MSVEAVIEEIDHSNTDEIVCPHCGEVHEDSWEYSSDDGELECYECEKRFAYNREVSVSYTTYKRESNYEPGNS